jgi:hypothetical protein
MNTVEDGRLMAALGKNLIALVESMEDCMAKGRLLPSLVVLYSAIDIVSSLESGKASPSAFMAWSDKYLLQRTSLRCTASGLYGARCGILYTLSAESGMSRKGKAHRIQYAWGKAKIDKLERATKVLGREERSVHVRDLINAFRNGLASYMEDVMQDDKRKQKLFAGASMWLIDIDQNTIKAFLDLTKPSSAS